MVPRATRPDLTFNVAQLLREDIGGRRNYEFAEPALELDGALVLRDVLGVVRLTRTASGVLADARVAGVVDLECIRCLAAVAESLSLVFRDEFHARVEVNTGVPLPPPDEDDPFFISENHMLDLGEAIREYALIAMPMRPLCKPECLGLCASCGVDRNVTPCTCQEHRGDDRFAALRALLDD
jgi:uncharacterized protein